GGTSATREQPDESVARARCEVEDDLLPRDSREREPVLVSRAAERAVDRLTDRDRIRRSGCTVVLDLVHRAQRPQRVEVEVERLPPGGVRAPVVDATRAIDGERRESDPAGAIESRGPRTIVAEDAARSGRERHLRAPAHALRRGTASAHVV